MKAVLAHHRGRIVERHAELERILARIDIALDAERGLLPYEVELVDLQPQWVVSHRTTTTRPQLDATLDRCLGSWTAISRPAGAAPPAARSSSTTTRCSGTSASTWKSACPSIARAAEALGGRQLPGGGAMQTVYRGPWDDIWQAYPAMLARIARMDYEVCGPVREFYLVDERDTDDPQRYVTEITWPAQPPRRRPS